MTTPIPIKDDAEFEQRLEQVCRFYRALREIWAKTNSSDSQQVGYWVQTGGATIETLDELLGDIEDYSGANELRLIWDQLNKIRDDRDHKKEEQP